MSYLTHLTSADLKSVSRLLAKKESLLRKLQTIDVALAKFDDAPAIQKTTTKSRPSPKHTQRGKLKEHILEALKAAGDKGHTVGELAEKLKVKPNNLYMWFYTTGKKVVGLKKSKDRRYSL